MSTIKDVAKKAEVSIATVSLVIHNHKRISSETRKKVRKAIKELNYHPSRSARGLVSQKSGNIGFLLTEDHFLRSEPFYTRIFLGTEFEARHSDLYILLTTISSEFTKDSKLPRFVLEKNVDGVIIAGKVPEGIIKALDDYHVPIVFADYRPSWDDKYSAVLIDNLSGGKLATRHLIGKGHKDIGFIAGDIHHPSINERFQGYKLELEANNIFYDETYFEVEDVYPDRENGYAAAERLLNKNKKITAIFTCNDAMAIGVLQYLKEKKYNVPGDIALIGFDDVEANQTIDPPLTTINVPKIEMGVEALKLMVELLDKDQQYNKKILIPVELIERSST